MPTLSAEVECFLSKAWVPLEAFASAFKMDFPTDPRADSPWQVDDNVTKELLFYTFRPTESNSMPCLRASRTASSFSMIESGRSANQC